MQDHKHNATCQCKPATHAFCSTCRTVRPVAFKPASFRSRRVLAFTKFEGGTLACEACGEAVAHLYREKTESPARRGRSLLQRAAE